MISVRQLIIMFATLNVYWFGAIINENELYTKAPSHVILMNMACLMQQIN